MGKKTKDVSSLGRSLIKDRFGPSNRGRRNNEISMRHTTEVDDGYDWGRLNLQSVTEESNFQEFLSTAELASTEFQAEKLNITFINPLVNIGVLSKEERAMIEKDQERYMDELQIPRRPHWDKDTTPEQLDALEKQSFLDWRRKLAILQESKGLLLTPYEKNLEFWRQLWRVVERSDVLVQIVDARRPLLFRCADLEKYVQEVSVDKMNLILINKADFLTGRQRQIWAEYFDKQGIRIAFFSATLSEDNIDEEDETEKSNSLEDMKEEEEFVYANKEEISSSSQDSKLKNSFQLLSRSELIALFKTLHNGPKVTQGVTTIGLVGYPNVGKSSTINTLMTEKKVSVSATPGKTKHFQTLFLDHDLMLCDCPGLVMPSFVATRAEMVLNGILPIDQLRDHIEPVSLLASLIPRHILEDAYGIMLPPPLEGEDPNRPPTPQELLNAYGYNRGFMTHKGIPDNSRAARFILKDFVTGKLLHCSAPSGEDQETFHTFSPKKPHRASRSGISAYTPQGARIMKPNKVTSEDLDKVFFQKANIKAHNKGKIMISSGESASDGPVDSAGKPWKKHNNRNKKEKLRRIYGHLDA